MNDETIVALLRSDPQQGIQAMMKEYYGLVRTITNRILYFSALDLEECVADAFIKVWNNVDKIDFSRGTLKEFIVCTARNLSIDRYRKIKRMTTTELLENESYENNDILDDLINKGSVERVKQLILGMPELRKEIVTRRYFLFESVKEIAERLNLSTKKVENQLYQAKLFIKRELEERVR